MFKMASLLNTSMLRMMSEEPRAFSIWTNNTLVVFWYAFVYGGLFSRGLSFRYMTIWFGSSTVNLIGEHTSVYGTIRTLEFVRDFLLLALPFILGVVINELKHLFVFIRVWLFLVSCVIYVFSVYLRWGLSEHKTHRYNMCVELLCHTVLPPILGVAMFYPKDIDEDFVFLVCVGVDIVLKLGRTVFVIQFEEPKIPNHVPREASWAQAVSNESFLAAFKHWDGGAVQKNK